MKDMLIYRQSGDENFLDVDKVQSGKVVPVTVNFDYRKRIGYATIRVKEDAVYADLDIPKVDLEKGYPAVGFSTRGRIISVSICDY